MDISIASRGQVARMRQGIPATHVRRRRAPSRDNPQLRASPLAGLAVSVKDLFDIEGQAPRWRARRRGPTCRLPRMTALPSRVCDGAGAAFIGRTNMTEFAFSGVGINPHFGTPANAASRE
jgi:aspartyl-tRNA(Asn)/glutamyl-tRNA(Gln) amidotransferase subunit A